MSVRSSQLVVGGDVGGCIPSSSVALLANFERRFTAEQTGRSEALLTGAGRSSADVTQTGLLWTFPSGDADGRGVSQSAALDVAGAQASDWSSKNAYWLFSLPDISYAFGAVSSSAFSALLTVLGAERLYVNITRIVKTCRHNHRCRQGCTGCRCTPRAEKKPGA